MPQPLILLHCIAFFIFVFILFVIGKIAVFTSEVSSIHKNIEVVFQLEKIKVIFHCVIIRLHTENGGLEPKLRFNFQKKIIKQWFINHTFSFFGFVRRHLVSDWVNMHVDMVSEDPH